MVRKVEDLRGTPDEVLIAEHDQAATHTVVGVDYYMQELDRRSRERTAAESYALARQAFWLTVANAVLSVLAVVIAVIALLG